MVHYFFDTSALAKYYHPELGSDRVASIAAEADGRVLISNLGFVEIQSVFAIKVRSGAISREDAGLQRAQLMVDVAAGLIEVWRMNADHFPDAERLLGRYGFTYRLRTLDALQLAVAIDLQNQGLLDYFVAADRTLLEVARIVGLPVLNPEERTSM